MAVFIVAVASAQQQTGRIDGQVTSAAGGPVRKATVTLRAVNTQTRSSNLVDTTDEQGRFLFENLPGGTFGISAERQGFLTQAYGARPGSNAGATITLGNGDDKRGLQISLVPQSVISGRITDQDGDPVTTTVIAMRVNYVRGRRTMTPAGTAASDDRGNYRLARLSAGRYYVAAGAIGGNNNNNNARPARNGPQVANLLTYYPGVVESAAAAPIQIAPGADMQGIDIRVRRSTVFDIRGSVPGAGADSARVTVTLIPKEAPPLGQGRAQTQTQPNGTFELRRVPPGAYILQASSAAPRPGGADPKAQPRAMAARLDLRVGDSNLEDVRLELRPTGEVAGSIKFEAGDSGNGPQVAVQPAAIVSPNGGPIALTPAMRAWNVALIEFDGLSGALSARAKDDGALQFTNVLPGKYTVNVNQMPQGSYVKSIRAGGQDVTYTPIDFTAGASGTIEIIVSGNAAMVTGTVRNPKGDVVPYAMVTIWPKDRTARPFGNGIATGNTDATGTFRFGGLAPGEYLIAGWEEVEQGFTQSPDFLVRFDRDATSVTVREGSRESVEAKLAPRDAILVAVSAIQ